jgi:hypothetical protein
MSDYIDLLARFSDLKDTSKDLLARKGDLEQKFTPLSVVKKPYWSTPDFNPDIANKKFRDGVFTPYAIIPILLKYLLK